MGLITLLYMAFPAQLLYAATYNQQVTSCIKTLQIIFSYYASVARNIYKLFRDSEGSCSLDIPEYQFADMQIGVVAALREVNHMGQSVLSADNNATSRRERYAIYRCVTASPAPTNGATTNVKQDHSTVCTAKRYLPPVGRRRNRASRSRRRQFRRRGRARACVERLHTPVRERHPDDGSACVVASRKGKRRLLRHPRRLLRTGSDVPHAKRTVLAG